MFFVSILLRLVCLSFVAVEVRCEIFMTAFHRVIRVKWIYYTLNWTIGSVDFCTHIDYLSRQMSACVWTYYICMRFVRACAYGCFIQYVCLLIQGIHGIIRMCVERDCLNDWASAPSHVRNDGHYLACAKMGEIWKYTESEWVRVCVFSIIKDWLLETAPRLMKVYNKNDSRRQQWGCSLRCFQFERLLRAQNYRIYFSWTLILSVD